MHLRDGRTISIEGLDGGLRNGKFDFTHVTFVDLMRHPGDLLRRYLSQV